MVNIFSDGSCKKGKNGAFGFIVVKDSKIQLIFARREENTTNNQMEINGLLASLIYVKKNKLNNVTIFTDSEYVSRGYNEWMHNWRKHSWKRADGQGIKNYDLWKKLVELYDYFEANKIKHTIQWVKSHSTNKFNNKIDSIVQSLN